MKKDEAAARRNYVNRWREARWRAEQRLVLHFLTRAFEALNFVGLYSSIASAVLCVLMSPHIVPTVVSRYARCCHVVRNAGASDVRRCRSSRA